MSRYKRISYASHPSVKAVDVVFHEPDGTVYPNSPLSWNTLGQQRSSGVELDESDVRELHAKLGEVIAGWDA